MTVGSLLGSQIVTAPAQAQISTYDDRQANCGLGRPFSKGWTTWSGASSVSWVKVESALDRTSGTSWIIGAAIANSGQITGAATTASADAGIPGAKGTFRSRLNHTSSFFTSAHTYGSPNFSC
jgi:hypothetical protein